MRRFREDGADAADEPAGSSYDAAWGMKESERLWAGLGDLGLVPARMAHRRVVTLDRSDPAHLSFDILRTRIAGTLRERDWTRVAITSPTPGCGKTTAALNLAFSFARHRECRTILLDLDLRRPGLARMLGVERPPALEEFLSGRMALEEALLRHGDNLAIGTNGRPVADAAELLQDSGTLAALDEVRRRLNPDIVLYDTPPMLATDDLLTFLPAVDGVILVVAAEHSRPDEVAISARDLSERGKLLGIVLNKCRYGPEHYGY